MANGKHAHGSTAICESTTHTINVRGMDLAADLIGEVGFSRYFFFLVTGTMPDERQSSLLDAVLVAIAEHGLVPSNQAARMTLAAAPDSMQGAVAAGILGCGSVVFGSTEICGRFMIGVAERAEREGLAICEALRLGVTELRAARKTVPGFGHPQHSEGDPRALKLLALARKQGVAGRFVDMIEEMAVLVPEIYGRKLPINVSGAIPAVMLDAGFPVGALKGIPILARTASLIAHLHEEASNPIGFVLSGHAVGGVTYDGPEIGHISEARE